MRTETVILTKSPTSILHNQLKEMTFGYTFGHILHTQGCVKQATK